MIEHYRIWLQKDPTHRMAMYGLAFELKKLGEVDAARAAFEKLLEAHPHSGAGWFQYGQLLEEEGEEEEAVAIWRRGLAALKGATDAEAARSRGEISTAIDSLD